MKGPSERLKYDMRRIWECPLCRHREGTGGNVTSRLCSCQAQVPAATRQYMRLVQDGPRRVIEPKVPRPTCETQAAAATTEIVVAATTPETAPAIVESTVVETTVVVNPGTDGDLTK